MKKLIIAGTGVAALGLAVLPFAGAFADSVTDTVEVTISSSCTVQATSGGGSGGSTSGRTYTATLANGGTKTWTAGQTGDNGGGVMTINCNNASGWNMTAVGSSTTTGAYTDATTMIPDAAGKTAIPTGTSGDSYWAFQVTGTGTVSTYNSFSAVPSTATKVAEAAGASAGATVNTGYQVHVGDSQQAGTYTGKVTYTINQNS